MELWQEFQMWQPNHTEIGLLMLLLFLEGIVVVYAIIQQNINLNI